MHSFTDEQLLNLINNTIKTKTEYNQEDFTGGSIQITSTNAHQLIKCRVSLFFGYHNKNAIARTIDIKEEYLTIWQHAILLKVKSFHVKNNGMDLSELNALMNTPSSNIVEVISNKVVSKGSTIVVRTPYELDADEISTYLATNIQLEYKDAKMNSNLWAKDIEKALRIDRRTKEQLIACIDWIYTDGKFWIPNILSGKKLREKFDQLAIQMKRPQNSFTSQQTKREKSNQFIDDFFAERESKQDTNCDYEGEIE